MFLCAFVKIAVYQFLLKGISINQSTNQSTNQSINQSKTSNCYLPVRDVPDSGWPVLPTGNCITSEYWYWPVLRVLIPISRKRLRRPTVAVGNTLGVSVYLYQCLTNTSVRAIQTHTPTLPPVKDTALGRPVSKYQFSTGTGRYLYRQKMSYRHTPTSAFIIVLS